jgi:Mg-chelatase subunit ChlI
VEREGISIWHPARFILVGTMNPEEGDLRPQLLDRFGLTVDVEGIKDIGQRVQIVERREEWESHPAEFSQRFAEQDAEIGTRIAEAIVRFPDVVMPAGILRALAELNVSLQVDGHRADLVGRKAAQALAAYRGIPEVGVPEVNEVADMVLAHRVKAGGRRELGSIAQDRPSASRASRS